MSALTDYFTSMANKIRSKTGKSAEMTPTDMVSEVDVVYSTGQANPPTQTKSCTPSTTAQTITPDSGKFLSSVSVSAIQTQTKTAPAIPSGISFANGATVTPDSGKYLSSVTIPKPFAGNNTILTSKSNTVIGSTNRLKYDFPSSGYYLIVTTNNMSDAATAYVSNCTLIQSVKATYTTSSGTANGSYVFIVKCTAANGYISFSDNAIYVTSGTFYYVKLAEL